MKTSIDALPLREKTRFRVELKHSVAIGPGKADILECIQETGSISEAGRRMGMSYQKVWTLVSAMNQHFIEPLVSTRRGGPSGGGATLTATGLEVLTVYREIERDAQHAVANRLPELLRLIRPEDDRGPEPVADRPPA